MAITTTISDKVERSVTMNSAKKLVTVLGKTRQAWSVVFNGTSTYINAGSEASIDNLHHNAFTLEGYFSINPASPMNAALFSFGSSSGGVLIYKRSENTFRLYIHDGTVSKYKDISFPYNSTWVHFAATYDNSGDRRLKAYIDGVFIDQTDAVTNVISDISDRDFLIGVYSAYCINGKVGWNRISDSIRYTENFIPPSRLTPPTNDANTVRLFKMDEGTGTTIVDYSANSQNATLSNGTWVKS